MGIEVHLAERTDHLADQLAALLAMPLPDPFAEELVVVPAKGVERWLTQRLSHRLGVGERGGDGVCAGVRFVNPRSLVALLTGTDRSDPWDPDRLVWPVLTAIDASLEQPWCATLARHLGEGRSGEDRDLRRDRRWSLARRLAGLFATYAVQRPSLVAEWSAGRDTDGAGRPIDADLSWQPPLWRQVVALVDAQPPQERHRDTLARIRRGEDLALPDRLGLFGYTRLPVTEVELVKAVGEVREVHLWLPTPSPVLWTRLWSEYAARATQPVHRRTDPSGAAVRHPLLSSLGRDSRELQRSLAALGPVEVAVAGGGSHPQTLLGWLQSDLRADRLPSAQLRAQRVVDPADRSVQVHATHGLARQIEVLREVLVGLLQDDPTLEPRDIVVLCPDIDTCAPLLEAGFGLGGVVPDGHPAHRLRMRLADRGLAMTNPFVAAAVEVVAIATGRATVTQVLDLASAQPVRRRFGFDDDDLATMTTWAETSGVRWGLHAGLRTAYRLESYPQNTWQSGLDRLLVGAAVSEDGGTIGEVLPLDDVGSSSVDLAGRLAEYVQRLAGCVESLRAATTVGDLVGALRDGVLSLAAASPREAWQVASFERELASVTADAAAAIGEAEPQLRLADLRALLEHRTGGRPTRSNFRTGSLTVCTMVPMRSVPHRVVALVGLDDGLFPRVQSVDGDDVLAREPLTGERDLRSEDRQLLLDAVLAATEHLVLTCTGANEHTGQPRPAAVPVGELLDALDATAAERVRDRVLVRHPLQPYDPRNLVPGELGRLSTHGTLDSAVPFSFDAAALRAAQTAGEPRRGREPFVPGLLAPVLPAEVALADLQAFYAHPVRAFLRQRLDVAVSQDVEEPDDAMPVQLDALSQWEIGDRMLRRVVAGASPQSVVDAELRRGGLPPAGLGTLVLSDVSRKAQELLNRTHELRSEPPRTVDVDVDLGGGRRVVGIVPDVRGEQIVRVHYSSLGPKHRLASWLDLLALSAAQPSLAWCAVTVGWSSRAKAPWRSALGPVAGHSPADRERVALDLLRDLLDVYERGMREPIPLALRSAHAWVEAERVTNRRPFAAAAREWEGSDRSPVPGERVDREHVLVFGAQCPFREFAGNPRPDERWNAESTRLGRYAVRLWTPLYEHERQARA